MHGWVTHARIDENPNHARIDENPVIRGTQSLL